VVFPVANYKAPTEKQGEDFIKCYREFKALYLKEMSLSSPQNLPHYSMVVHCGGGKGRAGTLLAMVMMEEEEEDYGFKSSGFSSLLSELRRRRLVKRKQ